MPVATATAPAPERLRRAPQQARARARVERVLETADQLLATGGAGALSTNPVAAAAGVSIGSLYHWFPDKEAIAEALAVRYWDELADLADAVAEDAERAPLADPGSALIAPLAEGFRARPGFLALWYGGLRTERVRDVTRPTRARVTRAVERILAVHWPDAEPAARATAARVAVLIGDGLLREAFRVDRRGDATLLAEAARALDAYVSARLA